MGARILVLWLAWFFLFTPYSKAASETAGREVGRQIYDYVLYDSSSSWFTMDQGVKLYLSTYRQGMRYLYETIPQRWVYIPINIAIPFFMPAFVHEEGHRSILTRQNIDAKNEPIVWDDGVGMVTGVTDETLKHLRDTDLPTFIYVHVAGIEADLLMAENTAANMFYRKEPRRISVSQHLQAKGHAFGYHVMKTTSLRQEEPDERRRDIVGHDFYGAIRHLHRPEDTFHRYTTYEEFTDAEENFFNTRVRRKTFLNLVDGFIFKESFDCPRGRVNAYFDYNMIPFGDAERLHLFFAEGERSGKLEVILAHNRAHTFPGLKLSLERISMMPQLTFTPSVALWRQPEDLNFNTASAFTGGSGDAMVEYTVDDLWLVGFGAHYKTLGYERGITTLAAGWSMRASAGLTY